jgi:hypothetical protein
MPVLHLGLGHVNTNDYCNVLLITRLLRTVPPVVLALALLGFALGGCQSTGQQEVAAQARNDDQKCQSMRYHPGTALYLQCLQYLLDATVAEQKAEASRPSLGDRLQAVGAALQSISLPPRRHHHRPFLDRQTACQLSAAV